MKTRLKSDKWYEIYDYYHDFLGFDEDKCYEFAERMSE